MKHTKRIEIKSTNHESQTTDFQTRANKHVFSKMIDGTQEPSEFRCKLQKHTLKFC